MIIVKFISKDNYLVRSKHRKLECAFNFIDKLIESYGCFRELIVYDNNKKESE